MTVVVDQVSTLSTKAETLQFLNQRVKSARILPFYFFSAAEWKNSQEQILAAIKKQPWSNLTLAVRSSTLHEDRREGSLAGHFTSLIGVGAQNLAQAIDEVLTSYESTWEEHQILIQPCLGNVKVSGVAFSRDPNTNGPYVVINYDDVTGSTESITSGKSVEDKCFIWHQSSPYLPGGFLGKIIVLLKELEEIFQSDLIDIEFAISHSDELYLFQARPLVITAPSKFAAEQHENIICRVVSKMALGQKRHPYLHGERTIYGVMPDWNPAEIIGIRPRPLALSLYRSVVTNSVWAYQRDNYGYNNLRSFPLLVDFEGLPYIDVRVSFNSFLPKGLPVDLAERLVNYYINSLAHNPAFHDKVEFEIIFSCYTLDLNERLSVLSHHGFSQDDRFTLASALIQLTNRIIHNREGLWRKDLEKIHELEERQNVLFASDLDAVTKMYWVLEDCKRYGTLPFAGLARAGFIAVQLLKSFVAKDIISSEEYSGFFSSLSTVSSRMRKDFHEKTPEEFLKIYGHLRPGTYDILSPRYDEEPELYFDWVEREKIQIDESKPCFSLNIQQLRTIQKYIDQDNLHTNVLDLLEFIKVAIESREYSKFVFTKSLSFFLKLLTEYAREFNLTADDCSYLDLSVIKTLYGTSADPKEILAHSIKIGKERFSVTRSIVLPPLLCDPKDGWYFNLPETMPNFITQKNCTGHVVFSDASRQNLKGGILFVPNADPGFDWIFSHQIAGFITQFGGVNSHMAIRAGELGIPAVIGAGEARYAQWSKARKLHLDALNKQVHLL